MKNDYRNNFVYYLCLKVGLIYKLRRNYHERVGLLFAPEKGEDTRTKIAEILRKKGIHLSKADMENLIDEIADVKDEVAE